MKVVSLVPSWTETLIAAGVDVVGRSRFCIHPKDRVSKIPAVGGTKDWNFERILELTPDLLILDKEENPKFMSEQTDIPYFATHVKSVADMPICTSNLARVLMCKGLVEMSERWESVLAKPAMAKWGIDRELPAVIEWGHKPTRPISKVIYIIWREPWMAVSRDTFIGSVLERCGVALETYPQKYPVVGLEEETERESTLLLFSTEPYPFLKKRQGLDELGFPYAFVDGEKFSWFGARSLAFLESLRSR